MLVKASDGSATASSFVDRKHQRMHAQQVHQQAVAARLHQQFELRVLPVELGGIDQHHGRVGLRGCRDHVARVLLVAGGRR